MADEVPTVLSFVLLSEIRDNQLAAIRRRVPSFVDLVNDDEARGGHCAGAGADQAQHGLQRRAHQALREEARAAVPPQIERYEEGEIIVRTGDLITARHIEALEALGLNQPGWDWWRLVDGAGHRLRDGVDLRTVCFSARTPLSR